MENDLILRLNKLNKDFYSKIAISFSQTRQQQWSGWNQLIPFIRSLSEKKTQISVLDIGCGNGRFFTFLDKSTSGKFTFDGIDFNSQLLQEAKAILSQSKVESSVLSFDLVQELVAKTFLEWFSTKKYDLLVGFGVFHHIPTQLLRKSLISDLAQKTNENGLLIISLWQFAKSPRFTSKVIQPEKAGFQATDFEKGDYLLGWDTESDAFRYCHSFSDQEITELFDTNDWTKLAQFEADGKENNLNTYLVLQRNKQ